MNISLVYGHVLNATIASSQTSLSTFLALLADDSSISTFPAIARNHTRLYFHWDNINSKFYFNNNCTYQCLLLTVKASKLYWSPITRLFLMILRLPAYCLALHVAKSSTLFSKCLNLSISLLLLSWDYFWFYKGKWLACLGNSWPPSHQWGRGRWLQLPWNGYSPMFPLGTGSLLPIATKFH